MTGFVESVQYVLILLADARVDEYLASKVEIPLIRHGNSQRIETLIDEESLLLSKYLRDEITNWTPRVASV